MLPLSTTTMGDGESAAIDKPFHIMNAVLIMKAKFNSWSASERGDIPPIMMCIVKPEDPNLNFAINGRDGFVSIDQKYWGTYVVFPWLEWSCQKFGVDHVLLVLGEVEQGSIPKTWLDA
jgi:hypothetical protein